MSDKRKVLERQSSFNQKEKRAYSFVYKNLRFIEEPSRHGEVQDFLVLN